MSFLTKADFLAIPLRTADVNLPGDRKVRIRELTGRQRDMFEFEAARGQKRDNDFRNMRAKMVAASVVNEDGTLMFNDSESVSINEKIPGKVLDVLFKEILAFNGMSQEAVQDVEKNLETGQNGTSG